MDKIERVRQMVESAFATVPVPDASNLIEEAYVTDNPRIVDDMRLALVDRHWRDLDPSFIDEPWSFLTYLSPIGFQHYLPARMIATLDAFSEHGKIVTDTLRVVSPSVYLLTWNESDKMFNRRITIFTPDQVRAVVAFLALYISDEFDFDSIGALRAYQFGWGLADGNSPERNLFAEYSERMYNWKYGESTDPDVAELVKHIFRAFADTPYPHDANICNSTQTEEPAEVTIGLRGHEWQKIHPYILADSYTALSFLTYEGFRYFVPAYMVSQLLGFSDLANIDDPAFHLSLLHAGVVERLAGFNRAERRAIIHYLEYRATVDEYDADDINAALASYWYPSIS